MPSRLTRYDVPGDVHFWTISCYQRLTFFWHDSLKRVVVSALTMLQQRFQICLIGYVIMPEHVHLLLYPRRRGDETLIPVSKLLHAFKQHVGFHGKEALRHVWRREGKLWSDPLNAWADGKLGEQPIWTPRGYDFNINRLDTLIEKLDYCHKNPITRALVESPELWVWSSYRFYEFDDRSVIAMDWDGRWPIQW